MMEQLIEVTALREHGNGYGETWAKAKGDKYQVPATRVAALIRDGLIYRRKVDEGQG